MPEISKRELKKFKELLEEKKELEAKLNDKDFRVKTLKDQYKRFKLEFGKYGSSEAYALKFFKDIDVLMKANKTDVLFYNWTEMMKYLTKACLNEYKPGQWRIKKSFRTNLLDRGLRTKIDRKYNTFKVFRCEKRKRTKK